MEHIDVKHTDCGPELAGQRVEEEAIISGPLSIVLQAVKNGSCHRIACPKLLILSRQRSDFLSVLQPSFVPATCIPHKVGN